MKGGLLWKKIRSYKIKPDNDIITFLLCCMAIPVGAVVVIIMVLDIFKRASVKRT